MPAIEDFKTRVRRLKGEALALDLAARHPDTPWYAKAVVAGDDLVLIPLGISVAMKLIPPEVLAQCRSRAQASMAGGDPV